MHHPAIDHLRRTDAELARVIDEVGPCELEARAGGTHFDALVHAIVYQQLSGKAAGTILGRFEGLYGNRPPTPEEVLATSDEQLRSVGLSRQKVASIKDLASKVASGEVAIDALDAMPDDEVIASLIRVRGIGRWSAQMFLMFRLARPNILPDLDLGVQKGIQHAYGLEKLPTPKDVLRIGERWAPFASIASWYMWRVLDLPRVILSAAAARREVRTVLKTGAPTPSAKTRKKAGAAPRVAKVATKRSRSTARKTAARKSGKSGTRNTKASRKTR